MANQPFDREIMNTRERPISGDLNTAQTELDRSVRAILQAEHLYRTPTVGMDFTPIPIVPALSAGFQGNGFRVHASNPVGLSIVIESGLGWFNANTTESGIGGISGLDDPDPMRPLVNPAALTYTLSVAPDGVNPRIDIVEVKLNRLIGDPTTRDILNPGTGVFAPGAVNKTLSYVNSPITTNGAGGINYKTGVAAGVPVAPAVSAGYVKIAEVLVGNGVASIAQNKIQDLRRMLFPGGAGNLFFSLATGLITQQGGAAGVQIGTNSVNPTHNLYVFAGDVTKLTTGGTFNQLQNLGTFNNLRVDNFGTANILLADQVQLAATQNLQVAIGQPYAFFTVVCETLLQNIMGTIVLANKN